MPWQLAISISILALVSVNLIQRHYSQRSHTPQTFPPALAYALGVAPMGLIVGLLLPHHVQWTGWLIGLLVVIGTFMALANWLNFKAIKQQPMVQYQLINQSRIVMIIILGWVVLSEKLTGNQIIGAGLLLTAAILAVEAPLRKMSKEDRLIHVSATILNLSGCLAAAIGLVSEKAALGHMDIGAYLIFGYSAQAFGTLVLASKDVSRESLRTLTSKELRWSIGWGWILGTGGVLYVYSLVKSNNISLIAAITSITLPLTALGAYLFLHEKENLKIMWAALTLGFIGLIALSLH